MSTIHDVAKKAGVSVATVSRTFNRNDYVRDTVRQKILKVAEQINYSPRQTARRDSITIVLKGLASLTRGIYESLLTAHLVSALTKRELLFSIIPNDQLNVVSASFTRGIIAIVSSDEDIARIREIENVPTLLIGRGVPGIACVYCNEKLAVGHAVEYLIKRGHRRIGLVSAGAELGRVACERLNAFREYMQKLGGECDDRLLQRDAGGAELVQAVAKMLNAGATAMIVDGEDHSLRLMYALNLLNKRVPDDVSVISYEHIMVSQHLSPPHTTIKQPFREMAEESVRLVLDMAAGRRKRGEHVELSHDFVERESVKNLRIEGEERKTRR